MILTKKRNTDILFSIAYLIAGVGFLAMAFYLGTAELYIHIAEGQRVVDYACGSAFVREIVVSSASNTNIYSEVLCNRLVVSQATPAYSLIGFGSVFAIFGVYSLLHLRPRIRS